VPDRSVKVTIGANVAGFLAAVKAAEKATVDLGKAVVDKAGKNQKEFHTLGMAAGIAGGAIGAGVGLAVKSFMDFDKAMSGVKAVSNATTGEMDRLREAALKAGADTAFSATDAARAEAELAKVGISTSDILGGALRGSLDLAAAGQLDLSESATIAGQSMKIFNLQGKDVGHVADLLAAGANKSAADVKGLGDSLRQGGLVAAQAGLSIEDTVGALSMFADNALIGSDAGTSLKTMLVALMNPSKQSAQLMQELGINAYDAQGRFVGLEGLAGQLQSRLGGLTQQQRDQALAQIFGNDAVRAANILFKEGASGVQNYTKAVNDQGAAGRMAATQMDNLAGDLEALKGSLETDLIKSGSAANGMLRGMTQGATMAANAYGSLPGPIQKTVTLLGGVASAALIAGGGMMILLPKIVETKAALDTLNISAVRVKGSLALIGKAAGFVGAVMAITSGIEALDRKLSPAPPKVDKLSASLLKLATTGRASGEVVDAFGKHLDGFGDVVKRIADPRFMDRVADFGTTFSSFGMDQGAGDLDQARNKIESLDKSLSDLVQHGHASEANQAFNRLATEANHAGVSTEKLRSLLPNYSGALSTAGSQSVAAASGTDQFGQAADGAAGSVEKQADAVKELTDQIDGLGNKLLAQRGDERAYQAAIDNATDALKKNGRTLNTNTDAGRANQDSLDGIASSANAMSKSMLENRASFSQVSAHARGARVAFENTAVSMGMARSAARALAVQLITIPEETHTQMLAEKRDLETKISSAKASIASVPKSKRTQILADIAAAQARLNQIKQQLNALDGRTATTTVTTRYVRVGTGPARASMGATGGLYENGAFTRRGPKYAVGGEISGLVSGPGTGTSDDVSAPWLSNGEFVMRSAAVDRYGPAFMEAINSGSFTSAGRSGGGFSGVTINAPITINGASDPMAVRRQVEAAMNGWSQKLGRQADLFVRGG
jgi:TP901 family phage tail tape measure protein